MNDPVTGGTVFWLNGGIDRSDIAYQDWCFIDPKLRVMEVKKAAGILWRDHLFGISVQLFDKALSDISEGILIRRQQESRYSTFEPSTDIKDIYRPDLLMLEAG